MYSTTDFSYESGSDTLTAEASELGQVAALVNRVIVVKSVLTGKEVRFGYDHSERNAENEITAWVFTQTDPTIKITRVVVYND